MPVPVEKISDRLSLWLVPHSRNNHHPYSTRHQGLMIFLVGIILSQLFTSLVTGHGPLTLGFATSIQKEQLITLTNQERVSRGAGALVENPQLSQAALLKAQNMFAKDYWAHVAPDGTTPWHFFDLVGYRYLYAGENLARGFDSSNGVVTGWVNSPSHRENLLNTNYHDIGMAVLNGQLGGEATTLVVQLFGTGSGSTVAAGAPPPVVNSSPTPTPRPTIVAIASGSASIVAPVPPAGTFQPLTNSVVQVLTSFKAVGSLNPNKQVLVVSLLILAAIFIVDSLILVRKRLLYLRPHAILHALVIISLIGVVILSGKGVIL